MHLIINPFTAKINNRQVSVFIKIEFENGKLSITGVEGPLKSGNCLGSCGQIGKHYSEYENLNWSKGWNKTKYIQFLFLWETYHLNDMQAGCEHQRALGWDKDGYDKHPAEACPTCGYKYGTSWLKKEIPQNYIDWLFQLPKSQKQPAWI